MAEESKSDTGHLNPESIGSLPLFKRMWQLGYLTNDSQEGLIEYADDCPVDALLWSKTCTQLKPFPRGEGPQFIETKWKPWIKKINEVYAKLFSQKHKNAKAFYSGIQMKERSYVTGLLHQSLVNLFINLFNESSYVAFVPIDTGEADLPGGWIPLTYVAHDLNESADLHLPPGRLVMHTSHKLDASGSEYALSGIMQQAWDYAPDKDSTNYVEVNCFDPVFGRVGRSNMFPAIIKTLETTFQALNWKIPPLPSPSDQFYPTGHSK
jgi:hypothetical protein